MKTKTILTGLGVLLVGICIATILFWLRNQRPAHVTSPKLAVRSSSESTVPATPEPTTASSASAPAPQQISIVPRSPRGLDDTTRFAVHEKLRLWLATKTGDTATQERLTDDALALLTDENTAEVMLMLTAQEFDTPFGAKGLEHWLKLDPATATRWITARSDLTEHHALIVARALLERPADLHAYADQLPDGTWKQNVLSSASLEAVGKSPVIAIALAQRMAPGDAQTNALETIAYDWFGRDLAAATRWTQSVEDPQLRERLLAVGAKAIANADPDLAAGWLVSSVKTEGVLNQTALTLVESWADQHPMQAANWVTRFSEAGPRKEAIELVLSHWMKTDPASANAWIQTLPEREAVLSKLKADEAERAKSPDRE